MKHDDGYPISGITQYRAYHNADFDKQWYIVHISFNVKHNDFIYLYLHKDCVWRSSTYNDTAREYTGWFKSYEEAAAVLEKVGGFPNED